ncbi:MAG: 4-alpha-glucanotransferase [Alphaproteobacteria bacterium]|nr:4-alpha-glucanotransferase [Alphaproteobacteria bacterium]
MSERAVIVRLAGRLGIEANFTDALGQSHQVSDDTLLALIGAFGLPADPSAALRELEEEERATPLGLGAAHLVQAESASPALTLRPPLGCSKILWSCHLETGEECSGRITIPPAGQGERLALPLPTGLPLGYHRLELEAGRVREKLSLIVAPAHCYLPEAVGPGARSWGLTCQLYGLRSDNNWGMGDFSDLARLAGLAGSRGAATLGINPLHALFAAEPLHIGPYSPSSRTWLNYLYIDPTASPGFAEDEDVRALMGGQWFGATHYAACSAELIDYGAVAACKRAVLEPLFRRFCAGELADSGAARSRLGKEFRDFQQHGGRGLADFANFEALHEHYTTQRREFSWQQWPLPMRNPRSPEVAEFAAAHRDRVEFLQFLQWEADRQLAAAARAGRQQGLSIGLYRDLAVGANPNGAEAWADQELVAPGASIGAPPDALSRAGQNWGLAPINPLALRRQGYTPFIASLRANMRHAGILRIDHVMSLNRLYWIPPGTKANAGSYVNYPFADLLRILALESHRQSCAIIGEDLGTVPGGFRETMRAANVLSYRVLVFERRRDGGFIPPGDYPSLAAATEATHDIATLKGFWLGRDIAWRRRLNIYPNAAAAAAEAAGRSCDRRLLLEALVREGLLAPEDVGRFLPENGEPVYSTQLSDAILTYLARSRARLMLVQLEDVVGESEQANLPGTTDAHPNWRRRISLRLEDIAGGADLRRVAAVTMEGRLRSEQG